MSNMLKKYVSTACFVLCSIAVLSISPSSINAQLHPLPGAATEPPVVCIGCKGTNSSGQLNAGLKTYPYSSPIKDHVGRYVDSTSTTSFQAPLGFRTARARQILTVPGQRGSAPPRVYIVIGSAIGAYTFGKFFTQSLPGGMVPISKVVGSVEGVGRTPPESVLKWEGMVYPDSKSAGWYVPGQDKQDNIGIGSPMDVDDRGNLYVAYTYTGWGIVKDDGRTNGSHFPTVVQLLSGGGGNAKVDTSDVDPDSIVTMKVGSKYYAVTASSRKDAVWEVTDPSSPLLVLTRAVTGYGIRKWDRDDTRKRVAVVTGNKRLRIYNYADFVGKGNPIPVYENTGAFADVAFDEGGTLWAAESKNRIWRLTPSGNGYTATALSPHVGGAFDHLVLHAAAGYIVVAGKARVGGGVVYDVRLMKIDASGPRNLDLNGFFQKYYHKAPVDYAQPAGYNGIEYQADVQIVKSGGKTYLMYSAIGLGDVFEIGNLVAPPPPPPPVCTCQCPCPATVK